MKTNPSIKSKHPHRRKQMAEDQVVQEQAAPVEIQVPMEIAAQMKMVEFDRNIAIAEANVAELKKQKMIFVYDTNLQNIQQQYGKKQEATPEQKN